jgi:hypothetical protein
MKYIKKSLCILLCLGVISVNAQRRIILSHGFGGDSSTWKVYQPELGRMLTSVRPEGVDIVNYNSRRGVYSARQEVAGKVANNNLNIAVVHSMGGLVWRELDRFQPGNKAGGIITLGTPNRGGTMMNALRNGTIQAELQGGCEKFGSAIASALLSTGGGLIGTPLFFFKGQLCSSVIDDLNNKLPTVTAPRSVQDMSEGSPLINNLTNSNTPTFKIGVFGVENSPVHIRLFSSFKIGPSSRPLAQTIEACNTDQELVDEFNTVIDIVAAGESIFLALTATYTRNLIWNWSLLIPAILSSWAASEWGDLKSWLVQSESRWHAMIGAGGFFTEMVNTRVFTCNDALDAIYDSWESRRISVAQMRLMKANLYADPNCFRIMPSEISFPINLESDGLFNAGAARIPTDPNSADHVVNLRVDGANHQELLNHFNMTARFREIFSGSTPANRFFITR